MVRPLGVAWRRKDPGFVAAIESRYLALFRETGTLARSVDEVHAACLATAVYRADRSNGGLRYRSLDPAIRRELEARLLRFATRSARSDASAS